MNVDALFDQFFLASDLICLNDAISRKKAQIRSVNERRCGNCDHWMKSTCVPEKQHGQFKSIASAACSAFTMCHGSRRLNDEFTVELQELHGKVEALRAKHPPQVRR